MLDSTRYPTVPTRTVDSLDLYVKHGCEPGGFLYAVLSNNLSEAVGRADAGNLAALADIVKFVYNELPSEAWGSQNKVNAWLKKHRG